MDFTHKFFDSLATVNCGVPGPGSVKVPRPVCEEEEEERVSYFRVARVEPSKTESLRTAGRVE